MIRTKFDDLLREKEYREKRRITLRSVAADTKLAVGTIQRLKNGEVERVYMSTLDKLCEYFALQEVGEIIEFVPAGKAGPTQEVPA